MEWTDRMNAAINYIEDNLDGDIDFNKAADKAFYSVNHFQRSFLAVTGMTPAEYTRKRRFTLAASELILSNAKVIDLAVKYGYDSPVSFARAFRNIHGITPRAARKPGVKLAAFPRVSFHIEQKGEKNMEYRIIDKPAFTVAGRIKRFTTDAEQNMVKIGEFCMEFMNSTERKKLTGLVKNQPGTVTGGGMLGICLKVEQEKEWSYAITVEWKNDSCSSPFKIVKIPAAAWAVFETTLDDIAKCWRQIYTEWFPSTGYEYSGAPELEVYPAGNDLNPDSRMYLWVPVVKKSKK